VEGFQEYAFILSRALVSPQIKTYGNSENSEKTDSAYPDLNIQINIELEPVSLDSL
jgi:hypothetical protein